MLQQRNWFDDQLRTGQVFGSAGYRLRGGGDDGGDAAVLVVAVSVAYPRLFWCSQPVHNGRICKKRSRSGRHENNIMHTILRRCNDILSDPTIPRIHPNPKELEALSPSKPSKSPNFRKTSAPLRIESGLSVMSAESLARPRRGNWASPVPSPQLPPSGSWQWSLEGFRVFGLGV